MDDISEVEQTLLSDKATASLTDRLQDLLSDNVLELAGLVLLGALIGIASTAIVKQIWPPLDDASPDVREARLRLYRLCGAGFGGAWTAVVVTAYLTAMLELSYILAMTVAVGLAVAGAAVSPRLYDLLDWVWSSLLPAAGKAIVKRIKKWAGK